MDKKWTIFDIFITIIMLLVFFATLYPVIYIIAVSFSDTLYIMQDKVTFFPRGLNVEAYKEILGNARVPAAYLNTIKYTAVGVAFNLFMTATGAYPLSRKDLFGRRFFVLMIIITMFFNGGIIPNYMLVRSLGMIDTIWALVIPNAIWTIELLIMKSFYESLDKQLIDSATIDGASEYRILFQIIIPLSKAALASIGLFYFMGHWNSFFLPLIYINSVQKYPLQIVLRDMLVFGQAKETTLQDAARLTPEAVKNATIFVSMVPVLLIYPFAQKYFVKGVMIGSIKG